LEYIFFILGFIILIGGASLLIDGASTIGKKLGIPAAIIGLTIVAIGTSLPELIINVFASANGNTDLAISNVLGSNIINILVIIGFTALLRPIPVARHTYFRDIPFTLLAIVLLFVMVQDIPLFGAETNVVGMSDGIIFLILLGGFMYIYYRSSKHAKHEDDDKKQRPVWLALIFIALGICGLYFGGEWIVEGAVFVASDLGMDEATIGLTIIAMATSLPELVTSIMASIKGNPEMAIGNAVGSCIFNILLVLGVSSLIAPLPFHPASMIDLAVVLASTVLLVVFVYTGKGRQISRVEGGLMLLLYIGYMCWVLVKA
jgi:cation:H+ antiporter